jgi:5-methylcytosine-specific restriction endonuclease McrA
VRCGRIGHARAISGAREITAGKKLARRRDHHACRLCGFRLALHVHHIQPRSKGGGDDVDNLITLCPNHHALVHHGSISVRTLRAALQREERAPTSAQQQFAWH